MARILIWSDLHAHAFQNYSTILSNGMNSRLVDAINCIQQIYDYVSNNEIDLVLCGGDLFHVRKHIYTSAFNAVFEQMAKFTVAKIPTVLIPGNHDQADRQGAEFSTYSFGTFLNVAKEPGWICLDGAKSKEKYGVLCIPYTEDVNIVREAVQIKCPEAVTCKLMLGHLGIQGATVGSDFVYSNPHDPQLTDLSFTNFSAVFLGHYHKFQQLAPNVWYPGAPLQHNWGDKGQERGFFVYDTSTRSGQSIPLKSPKFVEIEETDAVTKDYVEGNFVRIVNAETLWSTDRKEEYKKNSNCRSIEVFTKTNHRTDEQIRLHVSPATSPEELVEKYVKSGLVSIDGLEEEYLVQLGRDILKEVEEAA